MSNNEKVKKIKEECPEGTRIKLNHMDDPYHPVPDGTLGTVELVDDAGQIHMKWDNGRFLAIVPEADSYQIIEGPHVCPETIQAVIVEAGKHPRAEWISNTLESMQAIVGGSIQEVHISNDVVLVCNEEGKLHDLKANRSVVDDIIAGTFFIAGDKGYEHLVSLSDEQVRKYMDQFYEIEEHSQEEMKEKMGFRFFGF